MRPRNTATARRPRKRTGFRRLLAYFQLVLLLFLGLGIGFMAWAMLSVWPVLPSNYDINAYSPIEATRIYSSDGILLGAVFEENREIVRFGRIPKDLINATIAIEDSRFYHHSGVDFRGVARAVFKNVSGGRMRQGGSTLTQQLARNIYLTQKKTLSRKLQEAVLAVKIERNYSKEQILELYLNQVYYGSRAYGVETASRTYFGKTVKDLTLSECAMLAGLPQSPSSSSPYVDRERAVRRRNVVLDRMCELGYISSQQRDQSKDASVHLVGFRPTRTQYKAPYFVTYVLKELEAKCGEDLIFKGGLKVYTTLNYDMQMAAERAVEEGVNDAKWMGVKQAALVSLNPTTGYVRAMVGGLDFDKSEYNRAAQARRQPGSTFKAFVYTAAIEQGMKPYDRIPNTRFTIRLAGSAPWTPKNYDGRYSHTVSVRDAVARSINVPAVYVAWKRVGINKVIECAKRLGIASPMVPYPALALGSCGVTPMEMASAYGVFANNGLRVEPISIVRIVNAKGDIVSETQPKSKQVIDKSVASTMDDLFRGVVERGTARKVGWIKDARGKTGTTQEDRDFWFVGYVPKKLVTAVWAGNDMPRSMRGGAGGKVCGPIWANFTSHAIEVMDRAASKQMARGNDADDTEKKDNRKDRKREDRKASKPDQPPKRVDAQPQTPASDVVRVRVCDESGLLAGPGCTSTHTEPFISGLEPKQRCSLLHSSAGDTGPAPDGGNTDGTR